MKEYYLKKADENLPVLIYEKIRIASEARELFRGDSIVLDLGDYYVGRFSFVLGYKDMYLDAPVRLCIKFCETKEEIVESLSHNSYRQTGKCPETTGSDYQVSAYQRNGQKIVGNNDASFCIVRLNGQSPEGTPEKYYYQIIVFYTLDLPVIKEIFNFKAVGETKALYS